MKTINANITRISQYSRIFRISATAKTLSI